MAVGIVVIHMSILARVYLANKRFAPNDVFAFVNHHGFANATHLVRTRCI